MEGILCRDSSLTGWSELAGLTSQVAGSCRTAARGSRTLLRLLVPRVAQVVLTARLERKSKELSHFPRKGPPMSKAGLLHLLTYATISL